MSIDARSACLRASDDEEIVLGGARWLGALTPEDRDVISRARPPVLDIGCGPGRHVLALAGAGKLALGIDMTRSAVDFARARGAPVLHRSVFARVPGEGRWNSALLLDGNVGIGGDPVKLLQRVCKLLVPDGQVLLELEPPGVAVARRTVRFELGTRTGPRFEWAPLSIDDLPLVAEHARTVVHDSWQSHGRWFAELRRAPMRRGAHA